jgi:predicted TIM-barrel fold metal-dependent hydrolase
MIIDFHTHIFPDKIAARTIGLLEAKSGLVAATDGTPGGLLKSMHRTGIDMSVVLPVATKPSQFESIRMYAGSVNVQYPDKLLSFGGIHPDCADYKREIDIICEMGLVGIKIHPDYQGVMIDDERYIELLKYADKQGLIILTHAGIDIGILLENSVHRFKVKKVCLVELEVLARDLANAVKHNGLTVGKVVHNDYFVACV